MAGLVPAIHVFNSDAAFKTWMPATSAGMTIHKTAPLLRPFPIDAERPGAETHHVEKAAGHH
jgi:hypothetical protein